MKYLRIGKRRGIKGYKKQVFLYILKQINEKYKKDKKELPNSIK